MTMENRARARSRSVIQKRRTALLVSAAFGLTSIRALAGINNWTGSSDSSWDNTSNWSLGTVPSSADDLFFPSIVPGTGSTISLSGGELANSLTFNNSYNLAAGTLSLASSSIVVDATYTATIGSVLTGSGGLVKTGAGTLILAAANNYVANTVLDGGTVIYTADNTAVQSLAFGPVFAQSPNASSLNLSSANLTALTLAVNTNTASANTITIGSGKTLRITSSVQIGTPPNSSANTVTVLNISGAGTFDASTTGNTNFAVGVGSNDNTLAGRPDDTLDMSGLSNFVFSTGSGYFGVGYLATRPQSTVRLANTSNTITAATIGIGDSNQSGSGNNDGGPGSFLYLGAGTNVLRANSFIMGQTKASGNLLFQGASGSVVIGGQAGGASTTTMMVGRGNNGTDTNVPSQVLLAGHNATINASTVTIGELSGATGGFPQGIFTFDTGVFNVGSLLIGNDTSGSSSSGVAGTLTIGGPTGNNTATGVFNVNTSFALGRVTNTSTVGKPVVASFVMNGGTANINSDIIVSKVAAATGTTVMSSFTLAGGTLNMMGHAIAPVSGTNIALASVTFPGAGQSATLMNLGGGGINGLGLNMNGAGTLTLTGTNTYSGMTTADAGTLRLNGTAGANSAVGGDVTVNSGGTVLWLANEQVPNSATLILNSGGTVNLNGHTESVASFIDNGGSTLLGGGNLIVLGNGDFTITDGSNIGSNISVNGHIIYNGTTSPAVISGNVALSNAGNHNFNINDGAGDPDVTVSGVISGATRITKTGMGNLVLSGANTFGGASQSVTIAAGILSVAADSALGDTANSVTLDGGTLRAIGSFSTSRAITLGGSNGILDVAESNTLTISSAISGGGSLTKTGAGTLILGAAKTYGGTTTVAEGILQASGPNMPGNAAGSGGIINNGTVVFMNPTTTSGQYNTTISGSGNLVISTAVNVGANANENFTTGQTYTGSTTITANATMTLINSPGSALNTSGFHVTRGRLLLNNTSGNSVNRIGDTTPVTLNASHFEAIGIATANSSETIGALTVNPGGADLITLRSANNTTAAFGQAVTADSLIRSPGATLLVRGQNLGINNAVSVNGTNLKFVNAPALSGGGSAGTPQVGIIPGMIAESVAAGALNVTGDTATLATYDTNGVRQLTSSEYDSTITSFANIAPASLLTVPSNIVVNAFEFGGAGSASGGSGQNVNLNNGVTMVIGSGMVLSNATSTSTFNSGTIDFGSEAIIINYGGGITINSQIQASSLTKGGSGTLTLNGSNGITGAVNINQGTLVVTSPSALGSGVVIGNAGVEHTSSNTGFFSGSLQLSGGVSYNLPLAINGAYVSGAAGNSQGSLDNLSGNNTWAGQITLGGHEQALGNRLINTIGATAGNLTISGQIVGAMGVDKPALVKLGAGIVTLGGNSANTFTGTTIVDAGTLELAKASGVNAIGGNLIVNSGGTVSWLGSEQVPDSATLTLNSGGTLNLNGFTETVASFLDNGGTTILGGGSLNSSGDLALVDGTAIAANTTVGHDVTYTGTTTAATISGNLTLTNAAATHNFNINDGAADPDANVTGTLIANGSVTKLGNGQLQLSGSGSTISGDLTVHSGATQLAGGSITVSGTTFIGDTNASSGTFTQTSGTATLNGPLEIGNDAGSSGTVNLSGGTLNFNGTFADIGNAGNATFAQSGGTFAGVTSSVGIAYAATSTSQYTLSGGTLNLQSPVLAIGVFGHGSFVQSGGTHALSGVLEIGSQSGAVGSYSISAGSLGVGNRIQLGALAGANGSITLSGSGSISTPETTVGLNGTGTFTQTGGTHSITGSLYTGRNSGSSGTYSLSGGSLIVNGSFDDVGNTGNGTFNQSGGTHSVNGSTGLAIGFAAGSSGIYNLSGGSLSVAANESVGWSGAGTLIQTGGTNNVTGFMAIARNPGSTGTYTISGGTIAATTIYLGGNNGGAAAGIGGTGILNINTGGTVTTPNSLRVHDGGSTALNLAGGTLNVGQILAVNPSRFHWTAGAFNVTGAGGLNIATIGPTVTLGSSQSLGVTNTTTLGSGSVLNISGGAFSTGALANTGGAINWTAGTINITGAAGLAVDSSGPLGASVMLGSGQTLNVTNATTIGTSGGGSVTVNSGGTFSSGTLYVGGSTSAATFGGQLTVGSGGSVTTGSLKLWNSSGSVVNVNGNANLNAGGVEIVGGNIILASAAGTPGTLTLGGNVLMSGTSGGILTSAVIGTQNAAIVDLGAATRTFSVPNAAGLLNVSARIANGSLVKDGAGTLSLDGTRGNTFTGLTTVNAGTLRLNKTNNVGAVGGNVVVNSGGTVLWMANEQIPNTATLTLNAGGTINLNGKTETVADFVDNGGTTILGGGFLNVLLGDITLTNGTVLASNVGLSRDLIYVGTTTQATVSGNLNLGGSPSHNFNINNGTATPDVEISGVISGAGAINKIGHGTLRLSGNSANTYTGATIVNSGVLELAKNNVTAIPGSLTINGGTVSVQSDNQLASNSAVTITSGGSMIVGEGGSSAMFDGGGPSSTMFGTLSGDGLLDIGENFVHAGGGDGSSTFAGTIAGSLQFSWAGAGKLTLTGNNTLSGTLAASLGTISISSPQNVGPAGIFLNNNGTLEATSDMSLASEFTVDSGNISVAATRNLTLTGNLISSGGGPLVKTGAGTLTLDNDSASFEGPMNIDAGSVAVTGSRQLSDHSNVTIATGATLDLSTSPITQNIQSLSGAGEVLLGSNHFAIGAFNDDPSTTFSGSMSGPGGLDVFTDGAITLTGSSTIGGEILLEAGTVNVSAGGQLNAASAQVRSPFTQPTLVIGGNGSRVHVDGNFTVGETGAADGILTVSSGGTLDVAGTLKVADSDITQINLAGGTINAAVLDTDANPSNFDWSAGTLNLTASSLTVGTGQVLGSALSIGANKTLQISNGGALSVDGQSSLTVSGGGVVNVDGGVVINGNALQPATVTITGAESKLIAASNLAIGSTHGATFNVDAGAHVTSGNTTIGGGNPGASATVTGAASWTAQNLDVVTGNLSLGGTSVVNVTGTLHVNSALAGIDISASTVNAGSADLEGASNIVAAGGALNVGAGGLTFSGNSNPGIFVNNDATSPGKITLTGDVFFTGASGSANILAAGGGLAGTVDLAGGTRTFNIADGAAPEDMTIAVVIDNGALTKTGGGRLALYAANKFNGNISVAGGQLAVRAPGAIPAEAEVSIESGAALELNGISSTVGSLAGAGDVILGGGNLITGAADTSTAFSGTISGTGSLTKNGQGTMTASGNLSFAGNLTVNLGTLALTGTDSFGGAGKIITVNGTGPTFGTVAVSSDEALGDSQNNIVLASGHLQANGSFSTARTITVGLGGGTLDVTGSNALTINSAITGTDNGGLTKAGTGTLVLNSASNGYTGPTTLGDGTVVLGATGAIPAASAVSMASSASLDLNNFSQTIASLSGAGSVSLGSGSLTFGSNNASTVHTGAIAGTTGGIVKTGSGAMTLSGALGFGGGITVNGGSIILSAANTFAGNVLVNSSATISVNSDSQLGDASNSITLADGTLRARGGFTTAHPVSLSTGGGTVEVATGTLMLTSPIIGSTSFSKSGLGELNLTAANTMSGPVTVRSGKMTLSGADGTATNVATFTVNVGGTLELNNAGGTVANRIASDVDIELRGGTFRYVGEDGADSSQNLGALIPAAAASNVTLVNGIGGSTTLTFADGLGTRGAGATINFNGAGLGSLNKVFLAGQGDGFIGGWATVNNADFARYDSTLGVIGFDAGDYSPTFATDTHVKLTASASTGDIAIRTLNLDASLNDISVTQSPSASTITLTEGGLIKSGSFSASISGGIIDSTTGQISVTMTGGDFTVDSALKDPLVISKSSTATLVLTSEDAVNHTMNGGVYLNAGVLQIAKDVNLGANSGNGNDIFLDGGTLRTTASINLGANRSMSFNSNGGSLDVEGAGNTLAVAGANQLLGSGPLTKLGAGTLEVSNSNTYSGPIHVGAGTLRTTHTSATNSSDITLDADTRLELRSDSSPASFNNNIIVTDNRDVANVYHPATIDIAPINNATAGEFRLGALNMGNAQLNITGPSGSLTFTGITTLSGNAVINTVRDTKLAGALTGAGGLRKEGAGKLTIGNGASDTAANTYTGLTIVNGGVLELNKAGGTVAIAGDISMGDGTITLLAPRQISNTSQIVMSGGDFNLSGQTTASASVTNSGANLNVGTGTLITGQATLTGGNTSIGAPVDGGGGDTPLADGTVTGTLNAISLEISGGTTTVNPGGTVNIGANGLLFSGDASPALTLVANVSTPGKMVLNGDVTFTGAAGTASVNNTGAIPIAGTVDLAAAQRTFTVANGSASIDMIVTGAITNGGLRKDGTGLLKLTGSTSTYSLGTTLTGGTIEAVEPGSLGTGAITMSNSPTLNLRSDSSTASFGNDVVTGSATINVDRANAGAATTIKLGRLSVSGRLTVTGGTGETLEFTGATTLTGSTTLDNSVAVIISNAITGTTQTFTKDTGTGLLTFSGSLPNTYTGLTRINNGTMQLAKSANVNAVAGNLSIFNGSIVQLLASEQIADTATVTLNAANGTSTFDLNNNTESVAALSMTGGSVQSGTGMLKLAGSATTGNVTSAVFATSATISGKLDLGDFSRTFSVADGSAGDDLIVSAAISGNGAIVKTGTGTLLLSGVNTFVGGITLSAGTLKLGSDGALGSGPLSFAGGTLLAQSSSSNSGNVNFAGVVPINVSTGNTMTLSGKVTSAAGTSITKTGAGSLVFNGTQTHGAGTQVTVSGGSFALGSDGGANLGINIANASASFTANQTLASLTQTASTTGTVTIASNVTVTPTVFNIGTNGTLTKAGGGTLSVNTQTHGLNTTLNVTGGTINFNGAPGTNLTANLTNATVNLNAGSLKFGASTASSIALGSGTSATFNATQQLTNLTVTNAVATLTSGGGKVIVTDALSVANGGKIDLFDGDMIVRNGNRAQVEGLVTAGFGNFDWLGSGITSSTAAASAQIDGAQSLGVIDNAEWGHVLFSGQTVSATDILVKFTWTGDCNLDGFVDSDDFGQFLVGYSGGAAASWLFGDFDYNGSVNSDDFGMFLIGFGAFGASGNTPLSESFATELTSFAEAEGIAISLDPAPVPEPSSLAIVGIAAGAMLARRRRHR